MSELLHRRAVELGAVKDQPGGVRDLLTRDHTDQGKQHFGAEPVATIEDLQTHTHSLSRSSWHRPGLRAPSHTAAWPDRWRRRPRVRRADPRSRPTKER